MLCPRQILKLKFLPGQHPRVYSTWLPWAVWPKPPDTDPGSDISFSTPGLSRVHRVRCKICAPESPSAAVSKQITRWQSRARKKTNNLPHQKKRKLSVFKGSLFLKRGLKELSLWGWGGNRGGFSGIEKGTPKGNPIIPCRTKQWV